LDEVVRRFEEVTGHFDGDVGWSVFDVGFTYAKLAHGYTCFLVELYCCFNKVLYCYLQLIFAFGLRPIELNIVSVFLHKSTSYEHHESQYWQYYDHEVIRLELLSMDV
jgi:hypothetical protein